MTVPVITWDPPVPQRPTDSRELFNSKATAFVKSLPTLKAQINDANQWASEQYAAIDELTTQALQQVAQSTQVAESAADSASSSAQAANEAAEIAGITANYEGVWSGLSGSLSKNSSVYHDGEFWIAVVNIANVALSEPSQTNWNWVRISQGSKRVIISSSTTLTVGGSYFIKGNVNVTLTPAFDGDCFEITAEIGSNPKIFGNINNAVFGDIEYVEIDNQNVYQFIYNATSQKLEI